ncbi:MAG: type II toxin-antitoxin system HicA family toxin [Patescibacteria group bacterium]
MPKLPALTARKLIKILEQCGFQLDHKTGSHFIFYHKANQRRAVVPFHANDLPKGTVASILREAGITKDELKNLL